MSFFKTLFGGSKPDPGLQGPMQTVEHDGYLIEAAPMQEGDQFIVAGTISKDFGSERKSHRFIRADRAPTAGDAADMTVRKAKQIIEQLGDRMFDA